MPITKPLGHRSKIRRYTPSYEYNAATYPSYYKNTSPEVQQNMQMQLIQVGMRIRKSIADGYKSSKVSQIELEGEGGIGARAGSSVGEVAIYEDITMEEAGKTTISARASPEGDTVMAPPPSPPKTKRKLGDLIYEEIDGVPALTNDGPAQITPGKLNRRFAKPETRSKKKAIRSVVAKPMIEEDFGDADFLVYEP